MKTLIHDYNFNCNMDILEYPKFGPSLLNTE